jgi:hypothetical protein
MEEMTKLLPQISSLGESLREITAVSAEDLFNILAGYLQL